MSTEIQPTPETDARFSQAGMAKSSLADFARKLERERDSAKTLNRTLLDQLEAKDVQLEAMRELHNKNAATHNELRELCSSLRAERDDLKEQLQISRLHDEVMRMERDEALALLASEKSTRAAIALLVSMGERQHDIETAKAGFDALESILAAFPLESLKA